ncbi:MAG: ribosome maturation factor RimP [Kordiimonadaceae bacterium]|jgi:ribosome maturation factor RimP|nr:ribosome maturation factor RimP [Kordiimonadaceae bacterium]MBT6035476.1 ribosome maturation factor RimP [Kordiimonadaceae bacterium]MBT6328172.1 ribosome maturation factor RimP [Kordiimonadaceae bacterium]MBT7581611.1 ribosome maturation factor RimP [Kordiimonadaceae bacterium]
MLTDKIAALIEPTIDSLGYELVRVQLFSSPRGGASTLQIMAEAADGTMTVEACAKISRDISVIMDVEDPINSEYVLEVSSPGLDRPLTRLKDFVNYAGFETKVEMDQAVDKRRRFRGKLLGVEDELILLDVEGEVYKLHFDDIQKAKLVMTDELAAAATANPS